VRALSFVLIHGHFSVHRALDVSVSLTTCHLIPLVVWRSQIWPWSRQIPPPCVGVARRA
jgi:hypothetical protein